MSLGHQHLAPSANSPQKPYLVALCAVLRLYWATSDKPDTSCVPSTLQGQYQQSCILFTCDVPTAET